MSVRVRVVPLPQLLNNVYDISLRSQQSNLANAGVQTDCPHRERFGYGGDAAATAEAMMLNFNMAAFAEKRVRDFNAGAWSLLCFQD